MQEKETKSTQRDKQVTNDATDSNLNFPTFTKEEKNSLYERHLTSFGYLLECIKNMDQYVPLWTEVVKRLEQKILEIKPKTIIISGGSRIISRVALEKAFKNIPLPHPTIIELDSQDNYWLYHDELKKVSASGSGDKEFPNDVEQELTKYPLDWPVMYLDDHASSGGKSVAMVVSLKKILSKITNRVVQDEDIVITNLVAPKEHKKALVVDEEIAYFVSALATGLSDRNDPETITIDKVKRKRTLSEADRQVEIKFSHFLKKIIQVLRQA